MDWNKFKQNMFPVLRAFAALCGGIFFVGIVLVTWENRNGLQEVIVSCILGMIGIIFMVHMLRFDLWIGNAHASSSLYKRVIKCCVLVFGCFCIVSLVVAVYAFLNSNLCHETCMEKWINKHRKDPFDVYFLKSRICPIIECKPQTNVTVYDSIDYSHKYRPTTENEYVVVGNIKDMHNKTYSKLENDKVITYDVNVTGFSKNIHFDFFVPCDVKVIGNGIHIHRFNYGNPMMSIEERYFKNDVVSGSFEVYGKTCLSPQELLKLVEFLTITLKEGKFTFDQTMPDLTNNTSVRYELLSGIINISRELNNLYFTHMYIYLFLCITLHANFVYFAWQFAEKLVQPKQMYCFTNENITTYICPSSEISLNTHSLGILRSYFLHRSNVFDFVNALVCGFCFSFFFANNITRTIGLIRYNKYNDFISFIRNFIKIHFITSLLFGTVTFLSLKVQKTNMFSQIKILEHSLWILCWPLFILGVFSSKCLSMLRISSSKSCAVFFLTLYFWIAAYNIIPFFYIEYIVYIIYSNILEVQYISNIVNHLKDWFPLIFTLILYVKNIISETVCIYREYIVAIVDCLRGDNLGLPDEQEESMNLERTATLVSPNEGIPGNVEQHDQTLSTYSGVMLFYKENGEVCISADLFFKIMKLPGSPLSIKRLIIEKTLSVCLRIVPAIIILWVFVYLFDSSSSKTCVNDEQANTMRFLASVVIAKLYSDIFVKIKPHEKINLCKNLGFTRTLKNFVKQHKEEYVVSQQRTWDVAFEINLDFILKFISIFLVGALLYFEIIPPVAVDTLIVFIGPTFIYAIMNFSPLYGLFFMCLHLSPKSPFY